MMARAGAAGDDSGLFNDEDEVDTYDQPPGVATPAQFYNQQRGASPCLTHQRSMQRAARGAPARAHLSSAHSSTNAPGLTPQQQALGAQLLWNMTPQQRAVSDNYFHNRMRPLVHSTQEQNNIMVDKGQQLQLAASERYFQNRVQPLVNSMQELKVKGNNRALEIGLLASLNYDMTMMGQNQQQHPLGAQLPAIMTPLQQAMSDRYFQNRVQPLVNSTQEQNNSGNNRALEFGLQGSLNCDLALIGQNQQLRDVAEEEFSDNEDSGMQLTAGAASAQSQPPFSPEASASSATGQRKRSAVKNYRSTSAAPAPARATSATDQRDSAGSPLRLVDLQNSPEFHAHTDVPAARNNILHSMEEQNNHAMENGLQQNNPTLEMGQRQPQQRAVSDHYLQNRVQPLMHSLEGQNNRLVEIGVQRNNDALEIGLRACLNFDMALMGQNHLQDVAEEEFSDNEDSMLLIAGSASTQNQRSTAGATPASATSATTSSPLSDNIQSIQPSSQKKPAARNEDEKIQQKSNK